MSIHPARRIYLDLAAACCLVWRAVCTSWIYYRVVLISVLCIASLAAIARCT